MEPIVFFAIILVVIWVLSSIASAINKQQGAQRRQQFRETMEHSQRQVPPPPPRSALQQQRQHAPHPPQLNAGYRVRHPEMVTPPPQVRPPTRLPPQVRAPMRARPPQEQQRRRQQQQLGRPPRALEPRALRGGMPPPIPVLESDDAPRRRQFAPAPSVAPVTSQPSATQAATAPTISRWLKPQTLRQQFILTEILQPPLAMREERFR
jgi:hypothetical protein